MNDARADEPSPRGVTRWWRNPALARAAFGAPTSAEHDASVATEPDLTDPAQREFGEYELLELIGRGGMGLVYRARQRGLAREVAIKLLSGGPWASPEFVARFEQEARHAAQLQHPGIVAIHELGESVDGVYYAMQLVRGESLAQRLHDGDRWTPREAAAMLRQIAEAVAYAHSLGVLHLDLKPGNVLIDEQGHPLIADFGLARRIGVASDDEFVAGTPGYMAPEQAIAGHPLDEATDVWGLGAILHELLGGRPPGGDDGGALDATPSDLRAICRKCTAEAPGQRYASARALADDLGRFLDGRAVQARPLNAAQRLLRWARREPKLASALGLAVLILLVGTVATALQWRRAEASAKVAREQTWSVRGNSAWESVRNGHPLDAMPSLLANLGEREALGDSAGAALERLRLGTLRQGNVQWIDAIFAGRPGYAVALNRDGSRVAVSTGEEDIRLYDTRNGHELWRTNTLDASHMWPYRLVSRLGFTADGRHLIAERGEPDIITRPSGQDTILIDASNGRIALPPPQRFADFRDATYSADGRFAVLRNNRYEAQLFRVADWQALSPRRTVNKVNGMWRVGDDGRFLAQSVPGKIELRDSISFEVRYTLPFPTPNGLFPVWAVQPGGDLLAVGASDKTIRLLDTRHLTLRELKPSPYAALEWLSFSADGRWLTAAAGDRAFVWDVASGSGGALPAARYDVSRVDADASSGTVFVTAPPEAALWQLPANTAGAGDLTARVAAARKTVAQLPIGTAAEAHAAAYAPAARLAAGIDADGELRLWRWRRDPLLAQHAAPQIAAALYFDGRQVAVVDANRARVIAVDDEHAISPTFTHPQPVASAQLTSDGRGLVTASGRELRVFDWQAGRLRFPPIRLDDTPLRIETDPRAQRLLVSTGSYRNGRFDELLSSYDLRSGKPLATRIGVPGPLDNLRFSPDGRYIVYWRYGELGVRDSTTLRPFGRELRMGPDIAAALRHLYTATGWHPEAASDADLTGTPVVDAALDAQARQLTVVTEVSQFANAQKLRFDLGSGRRLARLDLGKRQALGLLAHHGDYDSVVWSPTGPQWLHRERIERPLPQMPGELLNAQAISGDGRWLASTTRDGVVLADRNSGEWASAPLAATLPLDDNVVQLAFAPDSRGLLARSYFGRWLWWPLPRETRPARQLQQLIAHLRPNPAAGEREATGASLRTALRANDSDPPRAASASSASPAPPSAASDGAPQAGYAFVDLASASDHPIGALLASYRDGTGNFATMPTGIQRYLGVDYDVRNMIALSMTKENPIASASLAVPVPRFRAAHLLLGATSRLQNLNRFPHLPFGYLDIAYTDGGRTRVPIIYGRDVMQSWADGGDALPLRIAWVETGPRYDIFPGVARIRVYAARMANPYPQRKVASIAFSTSDLAWSGPKIFAVTLETAETSQTATPAPE